MTVTVFLLGICALKNAVRTLMGETLPGEGAGQRCRAVGGQVQQYRRGQAAGAHPQPEPGPQRGPARL
jgi:hypothetical protein